MQKCAKLPNTKSQLSAPKKRKRAFGGYYQTQILIIFCGKGLCEYFILSTICRFWFPRRLQQINTFASALLAAKELRVAQAIALTPATLLFAVQINPLTLINFATLGTEGGLSGTDIIGMVLCTSLL